MNGYSWENAVKVNSIIRLLINERVRIKTYNSNILQRVLYISVEKFKDRNRIHTQKG